MTSVDPRPRLPAIPPRIALAKLGDLPGVAALVAEARIVLDPAAELNRGYAHLWLAWSAGSTPPIGLVLAWDVADELHIIDVVTHPAWRRQGVARALLETALDHARQRAARVALLEVRASNAPALSLYDRLGFAMVNTRLRYYDDGEDAVEMTLPLTAHFAPEARA